MKLIKFKGWKIKVYKTKQGFYGKIIDPHNSHVEDTTWTKRDILGQPYLVGFSKTEDAAIRLGRVTINSIINFI